MNLNEIDHWLGSWAEKHPVQNVFFTLFVVSCIIFSITAVIILVALTAYFLHWWAIALWFIIVGLFGAVPPYMEYKKEHK